LKHLAVINTKSNDLQLACEENFPKLSISDIFVIDSSIFHQLLFSGHLPGSEHQNYAWTFNRTEWPGLYRLLSQFLR